MLSPRYRLTFLLLALALVAGTGLAATAPPTDRDTALSQTSSHLEWQLPQGAAGAVLTVIGPDDFILRKVYEPAGVLTFSAADVTGEPLADGSYTWELRFVANPDSGLKRRVEAARAAGNDVEAESLRAQMARPAAIEPRFGSFRVGGGSIAVPSASPTANQIAVAAPRTLDERDQVIADDLIVQGSTCVGFDCVNNESFGFDTIRLKENNLRIKFEDTSVGTFPTTDWQLTANDSASGGANKFSIEDVTSAKVPFTVSGGAATNSLFIDSTGRVGFRTSTPVLDLHVNTSNTPALRLEQNNSGGFTAQTWDIAGNEANFFVRDVTGGSRLPFRIRPGAPTSSIDINASGNVGIGTASPEVKVDVRGSDAVSGSFWFTVPSNTDSPVMAMRRGRAGGAATLSGDVLGLLAFRGHDGTAFSSVNSAIIGSLAQGNFSATSTGAQLVFFTTPSGSVSPALRMSITDAGRVGIGTGTPTEKLEVSGGNIRVTGGSFIDDGTTLNVPDYVFEPGYELLPIDRLRTFLAENGHLPNVPSRDEIKSKGLNLSAFQMRLLEKVEELTLYTVSQHDQLEALKNENQQLRARLDSLERH